MDVLRANREKVKARAEAEKAQAEKMKTLAEVDKAKAQAQLQAEKNRDDSKQLTAGRKLEQSQQAGSEVGMVDEDQPKFMASLMKKAIPMYFEFWFLFLNLLAVSISLNCNRDTKILFKIVFAVIAFCFGMFYVMYYFAKVAIFKGEPCTFNNVGFFC